MHDAALVIPEDAPYCIGLARQMESFGLFFSAVFAREPPPACFHRQSGRDDRL